MMTQCEIYYQEMIKEYKKALKELEQQNAALVEALKALVTDLDSPRLENLIDEGWRLIRLVEGDKDG